METNAIATSELRLLLNAEAFGFGPTAAIADCFPHLRKLFGTIGYVGKGHTLDLQKPLSYDAIHDLAVVGDGVELDRLFAGYDVFLTALDFDMAERARRAGLWVAVYDPLTWYWKEISPAVRACHLYLAQDFFGVRERMVGEAESFGEAVVVPPIVSQTPSAPEDLPREHVLLNLGGLNNPYWTAEDTLAYARLVVSSVVQSGAVKLPLVIAANSVIAAALPEYGVRNFSREQMQGVLASASYALMTPGLGNIYDAARHNVPTIWLPPANDSQGQQLKLLEANGMADGSLDWETFVQSGDEAVAAAELDYKADQGDILKSITALVAGTAGSAELRAALTRRIAALIAGLEGDSGGCTALTARFGSGGAEQLALILRTRARRLNLNQEKEHVQV
ncbi:MAG: hypothetical protein JSS83_20950 [Cyanobacteria bacterium SZAS LIN-3]|nr:hypothetical protein [Cyanobacteria bacterium SZAS LIN-3]MBS2011094.1 hypothetical protein [Cyanobacteria bacterium SZAS TMP-1]